MGWLHNCQAGVGQGLCSGNAMQLQVSLVVVGMRLYRSKMSMAKTGRMEGGREEQEYNKNFI